MVVGELATVALKATARFEEGASRRPSPTLGVGKCSPRQGGGTSLLPWLQPIPGPMRLVRESRQTRNDPAEDQGAPSNRDDELSTALHRAAEPGMMRSQPHEARRHRAVADCQSSTPSRRPKIIGLVAP